MQGQKKQKERSAVPSETEVKGSQNLVSSNALVLMAGSGGNQRSSDDSENFYAKLNHLLESTGLSLIINVRETWLDLYLFYLEVTSRGGFLEVSQNRRWAEVVSALKLEGNNAKLPAQLEKLYASLLYQFEQLYNYRDPGKHVAGSGTRVYNGPKVKRNFEDIRDGRVVKKMCIDNPSQMTGSGSAEQKLLLLTTSENKEMKKRKAPLRPRNAYQMFLKCECARLKNSNLTFDDGSKARDMAVDTWRTMDETEKQPYIEESKKDKERYMQELSLYNGQQSPKNTNEQKRPGLHGDYHVTLQPDAENSLLVNDAKLSLAFKTTEKACQDPLFLIDLDAYCPLDIITEGSK